jgi:hypothetical protein
MLALILWLVLGWRAAAAELLAELAICSVIWSGGGGRRLRRALRDYAGRLARLPSPVAWR